jgi:tRNA (adenine57-N1/adenine58-N1)-methyltransferase catalytic subunit
MAIALILTHANGKVLSVGSLEKDYHCQYGFVSAADLKKVKGSGQVMTNTGVVLSACVPSFYDVYKRIKRGPQIIPLKDVAAIIAETGIGKNSIVVDAGAGSGALACFLGNIAKKVVSYELREDFAALAKENAAALGLKNVTVKNKSIYDGIDEKNIDVVTLDLPEPWKAVAPAEQALKAGGFIVSYSPTIPQVSDFVEEVGKHKGLLMMRTIEILQRDWELRERVIRPLSQQIGHSGFLTIVRKAGT